MDKNTEYYKGEKAKFVNYMNKNLYKIIDSHRWNLKRLGQDFWSDEDRDFLYEVSLFGFDGDDSDFVVEVVENDKI